jgi:hypothetical protein
VNDVWWVRNCQDPKFHEGTDNGSWVICVFLMVLTYEIFVFLFCSFRGTILTLKHDLIIFNYLNQSKLLLLPFSKILTKSDFARLSCDFSYWKCESLFHTNFHYFYIGFFFCEFSNTIPNTKQYHSSIVFNCNLYGKSVVVPIFILFYSYLYKMMKWITFLHEFLLFLYQIFFLNLQIWLIIDTVQTFLIYALYDYFQFFCPNNIYY